MAYKFIDPVIGKDSPANTVTSQAWPLGLTAWASDPVLGAGAFIYIRGGTNVVAGNAVVLRGAYGASQLATASQGSAGPVGVVYAPVSNSTVYGWAQVYGLASPVTISSTAAVGQQLIVASTAGCFAVTGPSATTYANAIDGAYVASSQSASSASGVVFLNYPVVKGA
jgi:hypothetical protein